VRSPWERALGAGVAELAAPLRAYFGAIPAGHVGRGTGVFEVAGTPRRWVVPERLLEAGYQFEYPELASALGEIVSTRRLEAATPRR